MKKIHFSLFSNLSVSETTRRLAEFFTSEHISFNANPNSLRSTSIPFPIVNFDRRMYTRKNWVGINPFIFISGIEMFFTESNTKETQVDVTIDEYRTIVMYLCYLCLILLVAVALPVLWVGISFFFFMAVFARLFVFDLCIKRLIKSEIQNAIKGKIGDGSRIA
jgi:hypothetical protein